MTRWMAVSVFRKQFLKLKLLSGDAALRIHLQLLMLAVGTLLILLVVRLVRANCVADQLLEEFINISP